MTDHLEDASGYYFLDPENKLERKPIHRIDCEIIDTTMLILERMGAKTLIEILNRWKSDPDADVLDTLETYLQSPQLEDEMKEKSGDFWSKLLEGMKKCFMTIQGEHIVLDRVYSISESSGFDEKPYYSIIINKERDAPTSYEWYVDKEFKWRNKEARDLAIEEIKKNMGKYTMSKFLN